MKKLFFIFIFFIPIGLFAQIQPYIVDHGRLWSNLRWNSTMGPPPYYKITEHIKFIGDTVMGDYHYKFVMLANDEEQEEWVLNGFIRENNEGKVYYIYPENHPQETLLYDFNIEAGESITVWGCVWWGSVTLHVQSVDTIFFHDRNRKRIVFDDESMWIAGMGSYDGVLRSSGNTVGEMYDLMCFYENSDLIYDNPDYDGCWMHYFTGFNELENHEMNVYPNPAKEYITLDIDFNKETKVDILNIHGQRIKTEYLNHDGKINITDLPAGVYLLNVSFENQLSYSRFIKL